MVYKTEEERIVMTPCWDRNIEIFINPHEEEWEYRYYYALFEFQDSKNQEQDSKNQEIASICQDYLKSLLWTHNYYKGPCENWTHHYGYAYPPLLKDLVRYVPFSENELLLKKDMTIMDPIMLLTHVLPRNSLHLLPDAVRKNLDLKAYREDYEIVHPFCRYLWEGHVKFKI